jgi:hypothetical protein
MCACFFAVSSVGPRFYQQAVERRTIQNEIASVAFRDALLHDFTLQPNPGNKYSVFLPDSRDLAFQDSDIRSLALCNADGAGLWDALFPGIAQRF